MTKIHELPVAGPVQASDWLVVSQGGRTRKVGALSLPAGATTWAGITDKPSTFPPNAHSHATSDVTGLSAALSAKEPTIAAGTTAQYWRGDKTWRDFFVDVRASTLTGLSTATNAAIAAADTVLVALGKLQAQVSAKFDKTGGDISGNVSVAGSILATSGALGYGVGAGGSVVQATSKATTVTLNRPCGQITMNGAALAAGATVAFTFSNTFFTATDLMVVATASPFGNYSVRASFSAPGTTAIYVTNTSGGSLSDAVVLNFAVIKGATS